MKEKKQRLLKLLVEDRDSGLSPNNQFITFFVNKLDKTAVIEINQQLGIETDLDLRNNRAKLMKCLQSDTSGNAKSSESMPWLLGKFC